MTNENLHPEQDPAEGSRETVERDLKRQEKKASNPADADIAREKSEPGSEAAEPSPE